MTAVLLTQADVAALLNLRLSDVSHLNIPHFSLEVPGSYGGTVRLPRYRPADINAWIASKRSEAPSRPSAPLPSARAGSAATVVPRVSASTMPRASTNVQRTKPQPARKQSAVITKTKNKISSADLHARLDKLEARFARQSPSAVDAERAVRCAELDRRMGLTIHSPAVTYSAATATQTFSVVGSAPKPVRCAAPAPQAKELDPERAAWLARIDASMGSAPRAPAVRREGNALVFSAGGTRE